MSTFKVPLTRVVDIVAHSNADKLEIVKIYDFNVIVRKGQYRIGDQVIYVPIDSILSEKLENMLFGPESKIKLKNRRVKQIRIRGLASQGMIVSKADINAVFKFTPDKLEHDYAEVLNIVKYEPPAPTFQSSLVSGKRKKLENPHFKKYNGIDNVKWFPILLKDQEIVVSEKLHGTNSRVALLPFSANTLWKKIKKLFGFVPKYELCYGSNNVQIQERLNYQGFYDNNVYKTVMIDQEKLHIKISENEVLYGEIIGKGIQKGYDYGCKDGEFRFVLFDVARLQEDGSYYWLTFDEVKAYGKERNIDVVPELYRGVFDLDKIKELTKGDSVYCPSQRVREGVVVKPVNNNGKQIALKAISEEYLDKDQTDFH